MAIKYDKLFTLLKSQNHSLNYWLRQNGFHSATVAKISKNQTITTETIDKLCELLDCQPGDIMTYKKSDKIQNT